MRDSAEEIFKEALEVLIMDAIYKSNGFQMSLLIITGMSYLQKSFYVGFAFMSKQTSDDYEWVLYQFKSRLQQLDIPPPMVILTGFEQGLISGLRTVFPATTHLLCIWHLDRAIEAHCIKAFPTKDEWKLLNN